MRKSEAYLQYAYPVLMALHLANKDVMMHIRSIKDMLTPYVVHSKKPNILHIKQMTFVLILSFLLTDPEVHHSYSIMCI
jgi:hypothetical protein